MYENGDARVSGDADDLVPMIKWVLSQSGLVSAEVEAEYMTLLLPNASSGEASYYLQAFHSAIHALKNFTPSPESSPGNSLDSVKQVDYAHQVLLIFLLFFFIISFSSIFSFNFFFCIFWYSELLFCCCLGYSSFISFPMFFFHVLFIFIYTRFDNLQLKLVGKKINLSTFYLYLFCTDLFISFIL